MGKRFVVKNPVTGAKCNRCERELDSFWMICRICKIKEELGFDK